MYEEEYNFYVDMWKRLSVDYAATLYIHRQRTSHAYFRWLNYGLGIYLRGL